MRLAAAQITADRQSHPAEPAPAAKLEAVEWDDPRLAVSFTDPAFDDAEVGGELRADHDFPMDWIGGLAPAYIAGTSFAGALAAGTKLGAADGAVTAVLQGRDGVYYLSSSLEAIFSGDGGGDWELGSGDLARVSTSTPELVAVVDGEGWFDLRAGARPRS